MSTENTLDKSGIPHAGEGLDRRVLMVAGVVVLGSIMAILDMTIVAVAQNTFQAQWGASPATVAWTMTGYTLALAAVIAAEPIERKFQKALKGHVGGWAFTPAQMAHLKVTPYEYNASAGSVLELLVLQRFWTWLATFIPASIAPCSITAAGFAINLLTCSILIAYSPDAKAEVPRWALALAALGVFLYQIADALDGKQCYKVQNTQIEEFYDHGCDAVSTILLMYATAIATQCGQYPALTLTVLFGSLVAFYSTHWQCYVTEQMVFGK